jgi:hypothetical protein
VFDRGLGVEDEEAAAAAAAAADDNAEATVTISRPVEFEPNFILPKVLPETLITLISDNVAASTINNSPESLPSTIIAPSIESALASAQVNIDPEG